MMWLNWKEIKEVKRKKEKIVKKIEYPSGNFKIKENEQKKERKILTILFCTLLYILWSVLSGGFWDLNNILFFLFKIKNKNNKEGFNVVVIRIIKNLQRKYTLLPSCHPGD